MSNLKTLDTDNQLLKQFQQGNVNAYEQLFKKYYEPLTLYAVRYLGDYAESEEVIQDLFCNLWEKRDTLNVSTAVKPYLFGAVRNNCLRWLKHQKVRSKHQQEVLTLHSENNIEQMDIMVELELMESIDTSINKLPEQRQKIFKMSRFEDKKYKDIAEQLNISIKTVEAQMSKALKFLRTELADFLPVLIIFLTDLKDFFFNQ